MDFTAFDTKKIDEYARQAKASWGNTAAYKEFEEKSKNRSGEEELAINEKFMEIFVEFGQMRNRKPEEEKVQALVKKLQDFITEHFYHCTLEILQGLGKMYGAEGEFRQNIDKVGGPGTADFTARAINCYSCGQ